MNESLDAIMEGDFEGEVFVENCILFHSVARSLLSADTVPHEPLYLV